MQHVPNSLFTRAPPTSAACAIAARAIAAAAHPMATRRDRSTALSTHPIHAAIAAGAAAGAAAHPAQAHGTTALTAAACDPILRRHFCDHVRVSCTYTRARA